MFHADAVLDFSMSTIVYCILIFNLVWLVNYATFYFSFSYHSKRKNLLAFSWFWFFYSYFYFIIIFLKYHPDVNKQPGATEKFKEISAAYEVYQSLIFIFVLFLSIFKLSCFLWDPETKCWIDDLIIVNMICILLTFRKFQFLSSVIVYYYETTTFFS